MTYQQFLDESRRMAAVLTPMNVQTIASYLPDSPRLLLLIAAAAISGKSLCILNRDYSQEQLKVLQGTLGMDILITDLDHQLIPDCQQIAINDIIAQAATSQPLVHDTVSKDTSGEEGELLILTSGTTGQPKCARYQWADLAAQIRKSNDGTGQRWLLTYHLNHFAGIQMFLHVLVNKATLVLAESNKVADSLRAGQRFAVSHVSATPTYWRFAIAQLKADSKLGLPIKHITLGSEAVTAAILDDLGRLFPDASISQVFAATEIGSCVSVTDGRPGLPISVLEREAGHDVQFKIIEDELFVRARHGMKAYLTQDNEPESPMSSEPANSWRATGDIVKVQGDRILFMGRKSEIINVGGVKVHPLEIEDVVSGIVGVKLTRAYGHPNPIMGQIVAVDIVLEDDAVVEDVENAVREACMVLARHSRPRLIQVVDTLEINNQKLSRQNRVSQ